MLVVHKVCQVIFFLIKEIQKSFVQSVYILCTTTITQITLILSHF
jgi:hypothetical protein